MVNLYHIVPGDEIVEVEVPQAGRCVPPRHHFSDWKLPANDVHPYRNCRHCGLIQYDMRPHVSEETE